MLASVVPYGGNAVRYALEKEKAKLVKVNHMPEGIDPTAIWYMMKHHCQLHQQDRTVGRALERFMVQFVISPLKGRGGKLHHEGLAEPSRRSVGNVGCCRTYTQGHEEGGQDQFP